MQGGQLSGLLGLASALVSSQSRLFWTNEQSMPSMVSEVLPASVPVTKTVPSLVVMV